MKKIGIIWMVFIAFIALVGCVRGDFNMSQDNIRLERIIVSPLEQSNREPLKNSMMQSGWVQMQDIQFCIGSATDTEFIITVQVHNPNNIPIVSISFLGYTLNEENEKIPVNGEVMDEHRENIVTLQSNSSIPWSGDTYQEATYVVSLEEAYFYTWVQATRIAYQTRSKISHTISMSSKSVQNTAEIYRVPTLTVTTDNNTIFHFSSNDDAIIDVFILEDVVMKWIHKLTGEVLHVETISYFDEYHVDKSILEYPEEGILFELVFTLSKEIANIDIRSHLIIRFED